MQKFSNITNKKFGQLTAKQRLGRDRHGHSLWLCECSCGKGREVSLPELKKGIAKSCGCHKTKEFYRKRQLRHGHKTTDLGKPSKTYNSWRGMLDRCKNKDHVGYRYYGGKGIAVCERWKKFENFLKDMGEPTKEKCTLDRINGNKGYSKSNCRWASYREQALNRAPKGSFID